MQAGCDGTCLQPEAQRAQKPELSFWSPLTGHLLLGPKISGHSAGTYSKLPAQPPWHAMCCSASRKQRDVAAQNSLKW